MRIYPEQLTSALQRNLRDICVLMGDEPFLLQEARDAIIACAKEHQITERCRVSVAATTDWVALSKETQQTSLFANRRVFDIRFDTPPKAADAKALLALINAWQHDLLMLSLPKLDSKAQQAAWFKQADQKGMVVPCLRTSGDAWINALRQRAKLHQINLQADALAMMAERTNGNLAAAEQLLQRLALAYDKKPIGIQELRQQSHDEAYDSLQELLDAILLKQTAKALRVLEHLMAQDVEPLLILGAMTYESRRVLAIKDALQKGESLASVWQSHKIWPARQPLIKKALESPITHWWRVIALAQQADNILKGQEIGQPSTCLQSLVAAMARL